MDENTFGISTNSMYKSLRVSLYFDQFSSKFYGSVTLWICSLFITCSSRHLYLFIYIYSKLAYPVCTSHFTLNETVSSTLILISVVDILV